MICVMRAVFCASGGGDAHIAPPEAWTSPIYPLISLRTVKNRHGGIPAVS